MERKFTIDNLSNKGYHNGEPWRDYISSTDLKMYLRSPKAYRFAKDNPQPQTEAMRFGSLFHSLMEFLAKAKGDWQKGYADWKSTLAMFDPPKNEKTGNYYGATTKAYAEAYEKFLADNQGKEVIDELTFDRIGDMANALFSDCGTTSKQVQKLLKWAKATEVSYFYEDEDGTKLKVRPDLLTSGKIVDWKTIATDSLDEDTIARQIIRYRYDISLSFYQFVINKITGKWLTPILVFVTKEPPYDAVLVDISRWCYTYDRELEMTSMGIGAVEFQRLLELHKRCERENEWPGAEQAIAEADSVMRLAVPAYFEKKYNNPEL